MSRDNINVRKTEKLFSVVMLELTNYCNFSCSFCPSDNLRRKRAFMSYEDACKLLDELAVKKMTKTVCFHLMGEPTLHPRLFDIARYANDLGLKVNLVTNGSTLDDEKSLRLLTLENAEMLISIQEDDEASFAQRARGKMAYPAYVQNILRFVKQARDMKSRLPIQIHYLTAISRSGNSIRKMISENRHINSLYTYWRKELGLPKKRIWNLFNPYQGFTLGENIIFWPKYQGDWSHQMLEKDTHVIPSDFGECEAINNSFAILADGNCTYCCQDFDGQLNLGNAIASSIEEVYYGQPATQIREKAMNGEMVNPLCKACRGRVVDKKTGKEVNKRNILSQFSIFAYFIKNYGLINALKRLKHRLLHR
jgi:sulfatase maturation enzyme AslB (radical SAM superfamily)